MNGFHSCDGTYIFIRRKMKCAIQIGFTSLNRAFYLSPHENVCTIALITIHYLYNIASPTSSRACISWTILRPADVESL